VKYAIAPGAIFRRADVRSDLLNGLRALDRAGVDRCSIQTIPRLIAAGRPWVPRIDCYIMVGGNIRRLCRTIPPSAIGYSPGKNLVFCAGICLMIAGTAFRWYSARLLGQYFTFDVATQRGQALIETGPYKYVRHPSYSGALVSLFGFGLALGNWASLIAAVSCLGGAYAYRIPVEEAALSAALGESYRRYMRRTWRLVPFLF
jgi:protein-S-isoprenylcysteine O-methyltransferase Ste14